jgi:hypothetical protein
VRSKGILRVFVAVIVFLGIAMAGALSASAQESDATITIHKSECPTGVGATIFEDCHDQGVGDVAFDVNGDTFVADEEGVLELEGPAGEVTITEDPDVFADYLGAYVYCRDLTDDEVLFDGSATDSGGTVVLDVEIGDEIVCDWYNITEAVDDGGDDGDSGDGGTGGTTTLPGTGTGSGSTDQQLILLLGAVTTIAGLGIALRRRATI